MELPQGGIARQLSKRKKGKEHPSRSSLLRGSCAARLHPAAFLGAAIRPPHSAPTSSRAPQPVAAPQRAGDLWKDAEPGPCCSGDGLLTFLKAAPFTDKLVARGVEPGTQVSRRLELRSPPARQSLPWLPFALLQQPSLKLLPQPGHSAARIKH